MFELFVQCRSAHNTTLCQDSARLFLHQMARQEKGKEKGKSHLFTIQARAEMSFSSRIISHLPSCEEDRARKLRLGELLGAAAVHASAELIDEGWPQ
jgi:hypothetical protein